MTYILHLSPEIEGDVTAAAEHYADIDPELGMRFADELERTLHLIESYPLAGSEAHQNRSRTCLN